ncbi:bifunctional acetate--CoA ligase family protein/GNAT family N-acetyltransferase [Archangium primigenium]|uniref:bifunctional acetate--CoA ligase family protein/GNAT family N-acetyltransferase n=1 Tax=[Archangium] primigenium TaxID=2792470 RepID=UPI001957276D|nr:bifunctional acetate--CoA ligase family protein/GNAT family N-acetyltransferase [Archangium primigenium]MBM7116457.1 bifunctional acetate--CoA ligase family protein/GNAT family N-acetyltransferase [Archangium primigenium]
MAQPPRPSPSDPSYDLPHQQGRHPLEALFAPRSVAVVGASERPGSVGRTLLWNLISSPFGGTVYPINPKRTNVLGIRAWPSLRALPEPVELVVIVTPAATVPEVMRECAEVGVKNVIIISAGFKEVGAEGARLEREVMEIARAARIRVIGPNCLGVMRPPTGLNATFAGAMARPGNVAFISQSGALLTAILDWSMREGVGFSTIVSLGSMMDVGWGDLIDFLGDDPRTRSILIYMESIGDARAFLSAAREVAQHKPIIVIKAGRTAQAAAAAASHTGSLAGSDEVLSAAFRRAGVLRVDSIADLFHMAEVLARQPRPEGRRLTVLTNAGGPGVLATDALVTGGGELAKLSDATRAQLDTFLPTAWSHANPVDILGDADPERYARALQVAGADENSDGLLVILTPQDMTEPTQTADRLKPYAKLGKPVLASWMGGSEVAAGERILNDAGIPTFGYPDTAARIFNYMWRYSYNVAALYETPVLTEAPERREEAGTLIHEARSAGRTLLTELESKRLLAAYGIPTVETRLATSADEAVREALALGLPVVLKLHSLTVTHKTDVGGVRLNLGTEEAVRAAFAGIRQRLEELGQADAFQGVTVQPMVRLDGYELILGSSLDAQFGPVLLFGAGGTLVEVFKDRALGLPPLNTTLARRMMEQTRIHEALRGVRGRKPVDLAALQKLLVRFSQLVVEQRFIKEVDINPLLASDERLVALDARVVLHGPEVTEAELPRLAILPYPQAYVDRWRARDGEELFIRPIRPEDEPRMVDFHQTLSEQSVFLRYAGMMKLDQRVAHERLARICFIDYAREMALLATRADGTVLGVGRLTRLPGTEDAEFAMLISDTVQRQGLGTEMLGRLEQVGRDWGLRCIVADILSQNGAMQHVCRKRGFRIHTGELGADMVKAVKVLS